LAEGAEAERLSHQQDLLALIKDEVNVLDVRLETREGMDQPIEVELDTVLTPELKRLGLRRELMRHLMQLRKQAGLAPADRVRLRFATESQDIAELIRDPLIAKDLKIDELEQADALAETADRVELAGQAVSFEIAAKG
jgi:isoleucyl-tRNA synthetase